MSEASQTVSLFLIAIGMGLFSVDNSELRRIGTQLWDINNTLKTIAEELRRHP